MEAIIINSYGGPSVLEHVTNFPIPKPQKKEICVRVHCAGVNPVDTYNREGFRKDTETLPVILGSDGSGVVEKCGEAVTKFKKGDKVFFTKAVKGAYAQFAIAQEHKACLLHTLTFEEGATVGIPYSTAYRAIRMSKLQAGHTLLVHGASGSVGLACVQLAVRMGVVVFGTAGTEQGLQLVKQNGAEQVFNHRKSDYIKEIMNAGEVNVILEMLANANLHNDLKMVARKGSIVVVGCRGSVTIEPRMLMSKECNLTGLLLQGASTEEWKDIMESIEETIKQGAVKPVIERSFPLAAAAQAHEKVIQHPGGSHGKILLSVPQ